MTVRECAQKYNIIIPREERVFLGGREKSREIVRIFYNQTCQNCRKKWNTGKRKFDVHHKDCKSGKSMQIDMDENISNLTLLCHKCHLNLPEHKKKMKKIKN